MNAYIPFPICVINVRTTLQPLRNCDRCCTTEVPGTRYNTTAQIDSSKTVKTYLRSFDTAGLQEYVLDCVQ
jgi:hypothetical protein